MKYHQICRFSRSDYSNGQIEIEEISKICNTQEEGT